MNRFVSVFKFANTASKKPLSSAAWEAEKAKAALERAEAKLR